MGTDRDERHCELESTIERLQQLSKRVEEAAMTQQGGRSCPFWLLYPKFTEDAIRLLQKRTPGSRTKATGGHIPLPPEIEYIVHGEGNEAGTSSIVHLPWGLEFRNAKYTAHRHPKYREAVERDSEDQTCYRYEVHDGNNPRYDVIYKPSLGFMTKETFESLCCIRSLTMSHKEVLETATGEQVMGIFKHILGPKYHSLVPSTVQGKLRSYLKETCGISLGGRAPKSVNEPSRKAPQGGRKRGNSSSEDRLKSEIKRLRAEMAEKEEVNAQLLLRNSALES